MLYLVAAIIKLMNQKQYNVASVPGPNMCSAIFNNKDEKAHFPTQFYWFQKNATTKL